jgi:hypothetical protein
LRARHSLLGAFFLSAGALTQRARTLEIPLPARHEENSAQSL